jgi:hypothetical protein
MRKGVWALAIGPIAILIGIVIGLVIAWYVTSTYPIACNILEPAIGGICWWIQFFGILFIIAALFSKFR